MLNEDVMYQHHDTNLKGYIAYDDQISLPRPAVLIAHDWSGRNQFACDTAIRLTKLGYVGFAIDVYGNGIIGQNDDEKVALMTPLLKDRRLLQERLKCALQTIRKYDFVNNQKIAIVGFCFGGLCALDLARTGSDIRGAVSFHGLFTPPDNIPEPKIIAKILALHGHDDPMAPPAAVQAFSDEMTRAYADWQIHLYGHTKHAFTNPLANDEQLGTIYNRTAATRAWLSMENFLSEIF